ncbi:MAG: hypothetical protein U9N61_10115 [Euryarchaeota archaeon]|nr:hypothetical protein [Euryarchaeota archaeon]
MKNFTALLLTIAVLFSLALNYRADERAADQCSDRWVFKLTGKKPDTIEVTFKNGDVETLPRHGNKYSTFSHPDIGVEYATAIVSEEWNGIFELIEGYCSPTDIGLIEWSVSTGSNLDTIIIIVIAALLIWAVRNIGSFLNETPKQKRSNKQ